MRLYSQSPRALYHALTVILGILAWPILASSALAQEAQAAPALSAEGQAGVVLNDGRRITPSLKAVGHCEAPTVSVTPGVTGLDYLCKTPDGDTSEDARHKSALVLLDAPQVEGSAITFVFNQGQSWWPDETEEAVIERLSFTKRYAANGIISLVCLSRDKPGADDGPVTGQSVCAVYQPGLQVLIGTEADTREASDMLVSTLTLSLTLDPSEPVSASTDPAVASGVTHEDIGQQ